jgi:hypothetical protein
MAFTTDGSMVRFSAAGYDSRVAGIDEVSARSVLAEMQDRLASDPFAALGITPSASAEDVRTAFLQLTKQYHPVRFGRMAADIQKLSNEVFLALRAAHDAVAKNLRRRSGPIPTVRAPAAAASTTAATAAPAGAGSGLPTAPPGRIVQQPPPKLSRPGPPHDNGERPAPLAGPAAIPTTPSSGTKPAVRPTGPQPAPRVATPPRPAGSSAAPVRDEAAVLDLLQRQQWDQARSALHQLSAGDPSSKKIRALMCYARGREAQLSGLVDDARVELQDALDLDPELQLAKTALTELFTRRK